MPPRDTRERCTTGFTEVVSITDVKLVYHDDPFPLFFPRSKMRVRTTRHARWAE